MGERGHVNVQPVHLEGKGASKKKILADASAKGEGRGGGGLPPFPLINNGYFPHFWERNRK